ncbi:transposase, partial [Nonomuraea guangzhouensis]
MATTDATVEDSQLTALVWDDLAARELLPAEHAVDMGYTSAALLVQAMTTYDVTLLGPMRASTSRQAGRDDGFDLSAFTIDFDNQQAICPAGHTSGKWREETSRGAPVIRLAFRKRDCGPCPLRPRCTTAAIGLRQLTIRPKAQHEALERARREQLTDDWKERYKIRAGVEGTISQAVRAGIRRTRYLGLNKTHLANALSAAAINLIRLDAWLTQTPLGATRVSHFARL